MCDQLRRIVESCHPIIVVSSTWRLKEHQLLRLLKLFQSIGARCGGVTPHLAQPIGPSGIVEARPRHEEIQLWLDENGPIPHFVILDDDDREMGPLLPHLVKTDSYTGLTSEIADKVIEALNKEKPTP